MWKTRPALGSSEPSSLRGKQAQVGTAQRGSRGEALVRRARWLRGEHGEVSISQVRKLRSEPRRQPRLPSPGPSAPWALAHGAQGQKSREGGTRGNEGRTCPQSGEGEKKISQK